MNDMPLDNITSSVKYNDMSDDNDITRLFAEATDKIKREAYARGWADAVASLQKAASEATDGSMPEGSGMGPAIDFNSNGMPSSLTIGSTPYYVYQAIKKRPGMTGSEIVAAIQEVHGSLSEGNIRTSIARVKEKKLIVARHNKWFAQ